MNVTASMELTVRNSEILSLKGNVPSTDDDCSGLSLTCVSFRCRTAMLLLVLWLLPSNPLERE